MKLAKDELWISTCVRDMQILNAFQVQRHHEIIIICTSTIEYLL